MKQLKIQIDKLNKSFGSENVLNNISLEIDNNSFYAICGQSGSGKSTLMNIIGLIENFDNGEYWFNDIKINCKKDYSQLRLENIGFIFQSYNLIPELSCYENIMMPTLYCKDSIVQTELIDSLVERMRLLDILEKRVNVLSGGEKQRVAIARALLLNPSLIIADEPTGNLDEHNKAEVLDILKEEHDKGRAVIIITHDNETAQNVEKIYELRKGRLYEKT